MRCQNINKLMKLVFCVWMVARISVMTRVRAVFLCSGKNGCAYIWFVAHKRCFCPCVRLCGWTFERFDMYVSQHLCARLSECCSCVRTCFQFDAIQRKFRDMKRIYALTSCLPHSCQILRHMSDRSDIQIVIFCAVFTFARLMMSFTTYIAPYRHMSGHFIAFRTFGLSFIRQLSQCTTRQTCIRIFVSTNVLCHDI